MSISSTTDPLQTVSPVPRRPPGPVRLFKALYNPTYLAIVASVGLHGLAVASLPVVGPMIVGSTPQPKGPLETNILQLTPAEAARLSAAFPAPKTTVLPPGLPSFNPNSNTPPSLSPPPLSGDLSQPKSGRGWSSIFGGNPSSETSAATNDPSRVASNWDTGDPSAAASSESEDSGTAGYTGNPYSYSYSYSPDGYIDMSGMAGSPPSGSSSSADTNTPDKTPAKRSLKPSASGNGTQANASQNSAMANADEGGTNPNSPEMELAALEKTAASLDPISGMRTEQGAVQNLDGNYPVLIVREADGSAGWRYLGNDPVAEAAIEYTFKKNPPSIPSEPGEYILTVTYSTPESETMPEVAGTQTMPPEEIPIDNPQLVTLQADNPDYETIALDPLNIPSPVSGRAKVAVVVDADGNVEVRLLEGTGNEDLDQQAIAAAGAGWIPVEETTIQTFEIQFNTPETSQPETKTPIPPQAPAPDSPSPESTPESPTKPIPKVTPSPSEESTPEPTSETEETVDSEPYQKPKLSPENTEGEATEETPIEPSPQVNPKKKPLNQQSVLPSF